MGIIAFSAAAYAKVQKALLPPGKLWSQVLDSYLAKVFLSAGDEMARISGRAVDIMSESDSATTVELAPEFETELLLVSTGTDSERQDRIVAREIEESQFRPEDVKVALAPYLALASTAVEVFETSRALAITIGDANEIYRFYVFRDPLLAGTPDIAAAQAELDTMAHSHTKGHVIESEDFLCDDPYSLCDRDILGI